MALTVGLDVPSLERETFPVGGAASIDEVERGSNPYASIFEPASPERGMGERGCDSGSTYLGGGRLGNALVGGPASSAIRSGSGGGGGLGLGMALGWGTTRYGLPGVACGAGTHALSTSQVRLPPARITACSGTVKN